MTEKTGRNDPCPCGSGKKYKACCMQKQQPTYSLGQRKFTAKVISKTPSEESEAPRTPGNIKPPDYTGLMIRSFGPAVYENDTPPMPDDPEKYLIKDE